MHGTGKDLSPSFHRPKAASDYPKLFGTSLQKHMKVSNCPRQKGLLTDRDMTENDVLEIYRSGDSGHIRK